MNTSADYQNNLEKEPSDMEQDINYTRERIGRTVEELEQRLSPGQLMDQALGYAREHGGSLASSVAGSVRRNPLPLIVTAVGIMWLMKSQSSKSRVYSPYDDTADMYGTGDRSLYRGSESDRDSGLYRGIDSGDSGLYRGAESGDSGLYRGSESGNHGSESGGGIKDKLAGVGETIKSKVSGMREGASSAGSSMGERLRTTKDSLSERAHGLMESAQSRTRSMRQGSGSSGPGSMDQVRRAKSEFTTLMEEQPLLLGAVGMAIGATIAALVPTTRRERELMGSASDSLADHASQLASQKYEELRETATQTVDEFTRSLKEGKSNGGETADRARQQTGSGSGSSSGITGSGSSMSSSGSSGAGSNIGQGMAKSSDQGVGSVSSSGLSGAPAGSSSQAKDKVGESMSRTSGSGTSGSSTSSGSGGSVSGSGLSGSGGSASRQTGPGSTTQSR